MKIKSFREWFADENYVEGECNCHIGAHLDYLISSDKKDDRLEVIKYFKNYLEYSDNHPIKKKN